MIRIIALDDHPLILKALKDLISEQDDMRLVATTNHGSKLLGLIREHQPDIAIVDLGMSTGIFDPISSIKNIIEQFPQVKVLILTSYDDGFWARTLMDVGASGYILKSDDFSLNIVQAILSLAAGGKFCSPQITEKLLHIADKAKPKLTHREESILLLLSQGKSTTIIAETLGISEKRVRNLLGPLCDKLRIERSGNISLRIAAINKARELGLLPDDKADTNMK